MDGQLSKEEALDALDRLDALTDALRKKLNHVDDRVAELEDQVAERDDRIATLESEIDQLRAAGGSDSKREKHAAIVRAALNKYDGTGKGVAVGYGEVMAAANVSRRYAYTLMEEIGAAHDWARYDDSGQKNRLTIDFDEKDPETLLTAVHNNASED